MKRNRRGCKRCGHLRSGHIKMKREPETFCLVGWDITARPIIEGCLCGEYK